MRLVRIEAREFAQYAELDLDLSGIDSAVIVGPNGAGKSKLMEAALWSMYGRARRGTTDGLIRDGRPNMWVQTTWDDAGSVVAIARSRSTETKAGESALDLTVDGERQTRHTIAETQAVIEELIGLRRDQLLAGPWMAQGDSESLMSAQPRVRKDLANSLFATVDYGPYAERASRTVAQLDRALEIDDARRQELEVVLAEESAMRATQAEKMAELETLGGMITELNARFEDLTVQRAAIAASRRRRFDLEAALVNWRRQWAELRARVERNGKLRDAATLIAERPIPEDPRPATLIDVDGLRAEAEKHQQALAAAAALKVEIAAAESHLAHVATQTLCDICPFREDTLSPEDLETMRRRYTGAVAVMEEFAGAAGELEAAVRARAEWNLAMERRTAAIAQQAAARTQLAAFQDQAVEDRQQGDAIVQQIGDLVTAIEQEPAPVNEATVAGELAAVADVLGERLRIRDHLQRVLGGLDAWFVNLGAAMGEIERMNARSERAVALRDAWRIVAAMLHRDGLPTMITENGLSLLEARMNETLARMPGEIVVRFRTQRLTKAGTVADELDIEVEEAGRIREFDLMSGAERFRIEIAWRAAVGTVLAHRSGRRFETGWLDEVFSAQDSVALEPVLEAIAAIADEFGLLLVVTHQQEVAERFTRRIEIGTSELGTAKVAVG